MKDPNKAKRAAGKVTEGTDAHIYRMTRNTDKVVGNREKGVSKSPGGSSKPC